MPTDLSTTLLSALFQEANRRDRHAREALFLTFSSDLGFFESQVLGTTRGMGAAVTVVAEARVYEPDPRAIRAAGVRYSIGLARSPAVFHPKLTVVAGPERALVGIGSGNLTIGGWQLNDEVLAIATGDTETGCPPLFRQVADWLSELTDSSHIQLGPTARRGILRTAAELRTLAAAAPETSDPLQLLGNHHQPIINQLPTEPVDELRLFAPFHDLAGRALDELITTLGPRRVAIALQDEVTVIDPHALLAVADRHGVDLRFDQVNAGTYRHGKLIDAYNDGSCLWTLSGSPNISNQAMTRSVPGGGNCELALLDRSSSGLYPTTIQTIPVADLARVAAGPPAAEEDPAPHAVDDGLLEATLEADTLILLFAHPLVRRCTIEISEYHTDPDQFDPIATLQPGRTQHSVDAESHWSYPLRLRVRFADQPGPIHFVTLTDQVTRRVSGRGGVRVPDLDPDQLFADANQAREWLSAVTEMALQFTTTGGVARQPRAASETSGGVAPQPTWDDQSTWQEYLDSATQRLGPSMLGFALGGLPRVGAALPAQARAAWEDDFTSRADETTADTKRTEPDDGLHEEADDTTSPEAQLRDVGTVERQRYRNWLHELVTQMPRREAIDRAAFARLVLRATRMPIWEPHTESGWLELLMAAARALPGDDIRPEHKPELGALTQVILHELATGAQAIGRSRTVDKTTALAAYLATEEAVRDLLSPVEASLIEKFADTLRARGTIPPDAALMARHAAQALVNDPLTQSLRALTLCHPQLTVQLDGPTTLTVHTDETRPLAAAGQTLDGLNGDWAIFAEAAGSRRAFACRVGSTMLTAERHSNGGVRFRTYRLTTFASVLRIASGDNARFDTPIRAIELPPLDVAGQHGAQLLTHLNLQSASVITFINGPCSRPALLSSGS